MLLDNEETNGGSKSSKRIKLIYSVLQIVGLIYGCWLFARYWILKEQYSNPLMPSYTTDFVFANETYKGMFLLGGMTLAQIGFIFRKSIGLILLILTFILLPFAFQLVSLIS